VGPNYDERDGDWAGTARRVAECAHSRASKATAYTRAGSGSGSKPVDGRGRRSGRRGPAEQHKEKTYHFGGREGCGQGGSSEGSGPRAARPKVPRRHKRYIRAWPRTQEGDTCDAVARSLSSTLTGANYHGGNHPGPKVPSLGRGGSARLRRDGRCAWHEWGELGSLDGVRGGEVEV
jgi:hypothetical protein